MVQTRSGFVEVNDARLYYEEAGAGQPFVMLHSHLLDSGQWDTQVEVFAQHYRVIRYDARGFGQSSKPATSFAYYQDLHGLMQALDVEHAILMGCSGGGKTVVDFALAYPAMADALILVGASVSGMLLSGPMPPVLQHFRDALGRGDIPAAVEYSLQLWTDGERRTPEQINPAAREHMRAMSLKLFSKRPVEAEERELTPPAIDRLNELTVPILAIVGSEDSPLLLELANTIAAAAPHAHKLIIDDAGHHPNVEHPETFNAAVQAFLSGLNQQTNQ